MIDLKTRLFINQHLKKTVTDYVFSYKSNGVYNSELKPLYFAFLHGIKLTGYKKRIKFDKDPLVLEQNNYLTKIVNVYVVYHLVVWSINPINKL